MVEARRATMKAADMSQRIFATEAPRRAIGRSTTQRHLIAMRRETRKMKTRPQRSKTTLTPQLIKVTSLILDRSPLINQMLT